jgi:hypothetical protein
MWSKFEIITLGISTAITVAIFILTALIDPMIIIFGSGMAIATYSIFRLVDILFKGGK